MTGPTSMYVVKFGKRQGDRSGLRSYFKASHQLSASAARSDLAPLK